MLTVWIIITIASFIIEIFTLGNLICIWFTFGGIASSILAYLHVSELWQYLAFFVVSIISMLVIRPLAYNYLRGNTIPTNSDRLINQTALLKKEITPYSWGEVSVQGTTWSAISANNQAIPANTEVKIVSIDGAKLVVKPLEKEEGDITWIH